MCVAAVEAMAAEEVLEEIVAASSVTIVSSAITYTDTVHVLLKIFGNSFKSSVFTLFVWIRIRLLDNLII